MLRLLRPLFHPDPGAAEWGARRRAPRHADEALTGTTRAWLRRLPRGQRPDCLCERYPRVANQVAWHWHDPAATAGLLQDLLVDRRGGRRGFPRVVQVELRRLSALNAAALQAAGSVAMQLR